MQELLPRLEEQELRQCFPKTLEDYTHKEIVPVVYTQVSRAPRPSVADISKALCNSAQFVSKVCTEIDANTPEERHVVAAAVMPGYGEGTTPLQSFYHSKIHRSFVRLHQEPLRKSRCMFREDQETKLVRILYRSSGIFDPTIILVALKTQLGCVTNTPQ